MPIFRSFFVTLWHKFRPRNLKLFVKSLRKVRQLTASVSVSDSALLKTKNRFGLGFGIVACMFRSRSRFWFRSQFQHHLRPCFGLVSVKILVSVDYYTLVKSSRHAVKKSSLDLISGRHIQKSSVICASPESSLKRDGKLSDELKKRNCWRKRVLEI